MRDHSFHIRRLLSLTAFFAFIALSITGVGLFIAPHDHAADWLSWSWMGINQDILADLHIAFSLLFFVSILGHMFCNIKPLLQYFKKPVLNKVHCNEMVVALAICIAMTAATLLGVLGTQHLIAFGEQVQESWSEGYPSPPIPNTESLTIEQLARLIERDPRGLIAKLEGVGITGITPEDVLEDIAEEHEVPPYKLYMAMQ